MHDGVQLCARAWTHDAQPSLRAYPRDVCHDDRTNPHDAHVGQGMVLDGKHHDGEEDRGEENRGDYREVASLGYAHRHLTKWWTNQSSNPIPNWTSSYHEHGDA